MTTETTQDPRPSGARVLLGAALATFGAGVVLAAVAAPVSGSSAALGALVGAALAAVVLSLGAFPMNAVARLMPAVSLAFALLTYLFQLMVLVMVLVILDQRGLVGDELSRSWLGGALMLGVGAWAVAHIVLATRARIPVYDLPTTRAHAAPGPTPVPTVRPGAR